MVWKEPVITANDLVSIIADQSRTGNTLLIINLDTVVN